MNKRKIMKKRKTMKEDTNKVSRTVWMEARKEDETRAKFYMMNEQNHGTVLKLSIYQEKNSGRTQDTKRMF